MLPGESFLKFLRNSGDIETLNHALLLLSARASAPAIFSVNTMEFAVGEANTP